MNEKITLELASLSHSTRLGEIHYFSLRNDFLPSLGLDFLQNVYYPFILKSKYAATYIAVGGTAVLGFVTIAHNSSAFTKEFFNKKWLIVSKYALRKIMCRPLDLIKIIQVLWSSIISPPNTILGEIVFIAVDEKYRNQGIGKELVRKSINYLNDKKIFKCRTKTLAANTSVIEMYKKMNWRIHNYFRLIGNEYVTLVFDNTQGC